MIDSYLVTLIEQCIHQCPQFLTFKPVMETRQMNNPDFQLSDEGVTGVQDEMLVIERESVHGDKEDDDSSPWELSNEEIHKPEANTIHHTNKRSTREVFSNEDTVQVPRPIKLNAKHQHQRAKKNEGIDMTDLNSILARKTEVAKTKAQA